MSNVLRCNLWTFDNNIFILTSWHKYKFWLLQQQQYRNCSTTEIQSLNGFSSGHIKYNCFRNAKYRKQYNYSFKTLRISTGNSQCLKIYKNVSFRIFNFGIFLSDLLKLSCLVTQALGFRKIAKKFWHFWWTFVHSKCKRSSLRSQCWRRLFLWFYKHRYHTIRKS